MLDGVFYCHIDFMDIQNIAALAEIIGVILVILSFVFLGLQVRASNKTTVANLHQASSDAEARFTVMLIDNVEIWNQVVDDIDLVDPLDRRRAILMMNNFMIQQDNKFYQYQLGFMDRHSWEDGVPAVKDMVDRKAYKIWRHAPSYLNKSRGFREFLERLEDTD